jgi:hypothetical protein
VYLDDYYERASSAIQGFSPIVFDGSTSRGSGLSHFIEFGDGEVSSEPTAVHPVAGIGRYTAQMTVVDRFGQSNVERRSFGVLSLARLSTTYGRITRWFAPWLG